MAQNPYTPPKAKVEDAGAWLSLSAPVRLLRALAVLANVILLLLPVLYLFGSRRPDVFYFVFTACFVVLGGMSLIALLSQWLSRVFYVGAIVTNVALLGFLSFAIYAVATRGRPTTADFAVYAFVVAPTVLNLLAVTLLRRARVRFARASDKGEVTS